MLATLQLELHNDTPVARLSSGLHLIFDLAEALKRRQQSLQLVVQPDTFVADVLGAVSLAGTARTSETLAEALEDVRQPAF
jgi:hypothetical protein